MRQIYISSTHRWKGSFKELLKTAHEYGIGGIELWAQQVDFNNYCLEEYVSLAKVYHLDTIIHSKSWDLNFASLNESIRRASIEEIKQSIRLAKQVNAKEITIHPPRETICGLKSFHLDLTYKGLKELYDYSCEMGVQISLEIMEKIPKELVTTDKALYEVTRDLYDKLSYTLDLAHCSAESEFFTYLTSIPGISKLHISNKIGNKLHTPLQNGDFDINKLMPLLKNIGIPIVIEGFNDEVSCSELIDNLNFLKQLKENEGC